MDIEKFVQRCADCKDYDLSCLLDARTREDWYQVVILCDAMIVHYRLLCAMGVFDFDYCLELFGHLKVINAESLKKLYDMGVLKNEV